MRNLMILTALTLLVLLGIGLLADDTATTGGANTRKLRAGLESRNSGPTASQLLADVVKEVIGRGPPRSIVEKSINSSTGGVGRYGQRNPEITIHRSGAVGVCIKGDGDYYLCPRCTLTISKMRYANKFVNYENIVTQEEGVYADLYRFSKDYVRFTKTRENSSGWVYSEDWGGRVISRTMLASPVFATPVSKTFYPQDDRFSKYVKDILLAGDIDTLHRDQWAFAVEWCKERPL